MRWLKSPVISPKTLGQCKARETKWAEALLSDADQQDCADVETLKAVRLLPHRNGCNTVLGAETAIAATPDRCTPACSMLSAARLAKAT